MLGAVFVTLFPYAIEALMGVLGLADRLSSVVFAVNYAAFGLVMILFLVLEPQGLVGHLAPRPGLVPAVAVQAASRVGK